MLQVVKYVCHAMHVGFTEVWWMNQHLPFLCNKLIGCADSMACHWFTVLRTARMELSSDFLPSCTTCTRTPCTQFSDS